jgi:putative spermidine/putrescine transport system permease protein
MFTSPEWAIPMVVSFQIALLTSFVATILGTMAAFALVRGRFPGRSLANALVLSPMIVPLVIMAIGMYAVFASWGLVGSPIGLIVAHTILALPFVVVNVSASLRAMERNLELASINLGAGPLTTFRYVTLPQIFPGVLAGALFAFIISWDEVVLAIFLTSPLMQTLPVVMWGQVQDVLDPTVAAVATLLTVVSTALFLLAAVARRYTERDIK